MGCKICGCEKNDIIYKGKIRNGGIGVWSEKDIAIYECSNCHVKWHDRIVNVKNYYESDRYRIGVDGSADAQTFYANYDKEVEQKFRYTTTAIFRDKIIADVGCAAGAFLDFLRGVAKEVIAIEPSATFRKTMEKKGIKTFPYPEVAQKEYEGKVDVVTSFDVMEHVEDPVSFLKDCYSLLKPGGEAIISVPTDTPVLCEVLGNDYARLMVYTVQHLWIYSKAALTILAQKTGFINYEVKYYQEYSLTNFIGWLKMHEPVHINGREQVQFSFVTKIMDMVYRCELENLQMGDHAVLYLQK